MEPPLIYDGSDLSLQALPGPALLTPMSNPQIRDVLTSGLSRRDERRFPNVDRLTSDASKRD